MTIEVVRPPHAYTPDLFFDGPRWCVRKTWYGVLDEMVWVLWPNGKCSHRPLLFDSQEAAQEWCDQQEVLEKP
jgi:hypothetical protein